jgi:hypothetical protein
LCFFGESFNLSTNELNLKYHNHIIKEKQERKTSGGNSSGFGELIKRCSAKNKNQS